MSTHTYVNFQDDECFSPNSSSMIYRKSISQLKRKKTSKKIDVISRRLQKDEKPDFIDFSSAFLDKLTISNLLSIDIHLYKQQVSESDTGNDLIKDYIDWYLKKDQSHFISNQIFYQHHFGAKKIIISPDREHVLSCCFDNSIEITNINFEKLIIPSFKFHSSKIRAVCFSSDGKKVASASKKKEIFLWNIAKDYELNSLNQIHENTKCMKFSPDNCYLAVGTVNGFLLIWDFEKNDFSFPIAKGHEGKIMAMDFSPDSESEIMCTGGHDKIIVLWNYKKGEILKRLRGHRNDILFLLYSPGGEILLSTGKDKNILVWDSRGKEITDPLKGHKGRISCLAFSPNEKLFASGSSDNSVIVWNVLLSKVQCGPLEAHKDNVVSLSFTEDSSKLISISIDKITIIWDANKGTIISKPKAHYYINSSIRAFSCDGQRMIMTNGKKDENDFTFAIWDTSNRRALNISNKKHTEFITVLRFSDDRKLIASDKKIFIWNTENIEEPIKGPFEFQDGEITTLCFSYDNKHVASGSKDSTILIYEVLTGKMSPFLLKDHKSKINSLRYSCDNNNLASGSEEGLIIIYNAISGKIAKTITKHEAPVVVIEFSEDGILLASGDKKGIVNIENLTDEKNTIKLPDQSSAITAICFSKKIELIGIGNELKEIYIYNIRTGENLLGPIIGNYFPIISLKFENDDALLISSSADCIKAWKLLWKHSEKIHPIEFIFDISNDGKKIISPGKENTDLIIYDSFTGDQIFHIVRSHLHKINFAFFSPDSINFITGSDDCTLILWEVSSGKPVSKPFQGHSESIRSAVFSKTGWKIASGSKSIFIWDKENFKKILGPLEGHYEDVYSLAFSNDELKLASGADDGKIIIWNLENGTIISEIDRAHLDLITSIKFKDDDSTFYSSSFDSEIKVWNALNGVLISTKKVHNQEVYALKFSPNQTKMITAGNDNRGIVWNIDLEGNFFREFKFPNGVKYVHWSNHNDIFFCFDDSVQCYFNYISNEQIFFTKGLILSEFYKNAKSFSNEKFLDVINGNIGEICPFYYTFLHVVAYTDDIYGFFRLVVLKQLKKRKQKINFSAFFKKDIHDNSCVDIIFKKSNKDLIKTIFNYFSKNYKAGMLYNENFTDKITLKLLNQTMDIFGHDTNIVKNILNLCYDTPCNFPEHFVYKGFEGEFDVELKEPVLDEKYCKNLLASNEEIESNTWLSFLLKDKDIFQTQQIVGANCLFIKDFINYNNEEAVLFFKKLSKLLPLNPIFDCPIISKVISYKWKSYASYLFWKDAFIFFAYMIVFCANAIFILPYRLIKDPNDPIWTVISLVLDSIILLFVFFNIISEFRQYSYYGWKDYIHSVWNIIDLSLIFLTLISTMQDVLNCLDCYGRETDLKLMQSITIFILFLRSISFSRGYQGMAFMVRLIIEVVYDIRYFFIIVLTFILALSMSTYVIQKTFKHGRFYIFTSFFRSMMGDTGNYDDLKVDYPMVQLAFLYICNIMLVIVLLNLLISLIGDTFGKVKGSESLTRTFEMANLLYEVDSELSSSGENKSGYYCNLYSLVETEQKSEIIEKINQRTKINKLKSKAIKKDVHNVLKHLKMRELKE